MCDYPFFIPQVVLFANSSLFWFKVTNEHREFRNYLLLYGLIPQILAVPFHVLFYQSAEWSDNQDLQWVGYDEVQADGLEPDEDEI